MQIIAVGLNHKTASLQLRETLSFTSATLCAFLNDLKQLYPPIDSPIHESVIISTCNRLEYYAATPNPAESYAAIVQQLSQFFQISPDTFDNQLYFYENDAAVQHLMEVAAGLDSLVLGEAQILGQIVNAHQSAQAHNATGPILTRLFQTAIHAGKRARTETDIGLNPSSISSVAVRTAQKHLGNLSSKTVLVLGAGEMGALAAQSLVKHGIGHLIIANRTRQNAETLAAEWDAEAITFDELADGLHRADVIVASTGAPHIVLNQPQLAQAQQTRQQRPLLLIDIALPRDVDPAAGELPGVHLYNLDDLKTQVEDNINARAREIPKIQIIIDEESAAFFEWLHSLDVVSTITSLREEFEDIRQQELQRTLNRLDGLGEREQKAVAELSWRLLNKFLHQPTVRLRAEAARGNGTEYVHALTQLFALNSD